MRLGVRVAGVDVDDVVEDVLGEVPDGGAPRVEFGERARELVESGLRPERVPEPERPKPLEGSVEERVLLARAGRR